MKRVVLEPIHESVHLPTEERLLEGLLAKELKVLMSCGGKGLCATCHCFIDAGADQLTPRTERENRTLGLISGVNEQSRLACQARVLGPGVVVRLPKGMYIERAEDLMSLLGTRAPEDVLHPIDASVLVPKDKIITRSRIRELESLNVEVQSIRHER